MAEHGLILADAGRARFFVADALLEDVQEVVDLVNPDAHLSSQERLTDSMGRRRGASMDPRTEPRHHVDDVFARRVGEQAEALAGRVNRWIVVAPPRFLGRLRELLPRVVQEVVVAEVARDLSKVPVHDVGERVRGVLPDLSGLPD